MNSLFSHYMKKDDDEELQVLNPYDNVFGKRVVRRIKDKSSYVEKLTFAEFKDSV